jgi:hypothetical protein
VLSVHAPVFAVLQSVIVASSGEGESGATPPGQERSAGIEPPGESRENGTAEVDANSSPLRDAMAATPLPSIQVREPPQRAVRRGARGAAVRVLWEHRPLKASFPTSILLEPPRPHPRSPPARTMAVPQCPLPVLCISRAPAWESRCPPPTRAWQGRNRRGKGPRGRTPPTPR